MRMTPPSLRAVPRSIPGLAQATRFLKIAGPVCFLNSIKVLFVASLVQAVTAISPASSAANGVMTAIYFFFAVMGDGVSQAAQTFLPPVLGSRRATGTAAMLLIAAAGLGALNAVASAGVALAMPGLFTKSAEVVAIMDTRRAAAAFAASDFSPPPPRRRSRHAYDIASTANAAIRPQLSSKT